MWCGVALRSRECAAPTLYVNRKPGRATLCPSITHVAALAAIPCTLLLWTIVPLVVPCLVAVIIIKFSQGLSRFSAALFVSNA